MRILSLLPVALALVFLPTGCGTTCRRPLPVQMSALQLGMGKEQVMRVLGRPSDVGTGKIHTGPNTTVGDGFSELFCYTRTEGGKPRHWLVVFVGNRVTEYGAFEGSLRGRYEGVFPNK
jgi:hypothetical protein